MSVEAYNQDQERPRSIESDAEQIVLKNFRIIERNADPETGLIPAVDPQYKTPESIADDMSKAWVRDTAWNIEAILESVNELEKANPNSESALEMRQFLDDEIKRILGFIGQDRWLSKFRQEIKENEQCTYLSSEAPEVHMDVNGEKCEWDQNQPESWGVLLVGIGKAKENGTILEYTENEKEAVRSMTEYLVNIKPWKFAGAGMWEGLPAHSPSSRSNALAIAKGLESVSSLFSDDLIFAQKVNDTVDKCMEFVREDADTDFTMPEDHPDGADLAMLVAMSLPETPKTGMPFAKYIEKNGDTLGIGELPGAIRFIGDKYKRGEMGEARWFMAEPILAIGYFREARNAFEKGDYDLAYKYKQIADKRLKKVLDMSEKFGHSPELFPELFIQRDPNSVRGQKNIIEMNDGDKTVALEPLDRSLIWNSALVMTASAMSNSISKLDIETHLGHGISKAA